MDLLWGKDKVRQARNETFDKPKAIASKRLERKQRQLIEADESSDEEEEQVSMMVLPDYSSGSGEKDINVLGFCLRSASTHACSALSSIHPSIHPSLSALCTYTEATGHALPM